MARRKPRKPGDDALARSAAVVVIARPDITVEAVVAQLSMPLGRHRRDGFCAIGQHEEFNELERWTRDAFAEIQHTVDTRLSGSYMLLASA